MRAADKNGTLYSTEEITCGRIGKQIVFTKDGMIFLIGVENRLFTRDLLSLARNNYISKRTNLIEGRSIPLSQTLV